MRKSNDVILRTVTKVAVVIIFTFAINLFVSGHHQPGGGFIGGLAFSSGLLLLLLTYDIATVEKYFPVDFKALAAFGVLIALLTGAASILFDAPFLTQAYDTFEFPVFGDVELATAVLFDVGVALAVIGTALTIIMSIGDDR